MRPAMTRPSTSVGPPAANGMIMVIDRSGNFCAVASLLNARMAAARVVANTFTFIVIYSRYGSSSPGWLNNSPNVRLWNISARGRIGLLGFDVGCADHLSPLLGFVGDEFPKVGGRERQHQCCQLQRLGSISARPAGSYRIKLHGRPCARKGAKMPINVATGSLPLDEVPPCRLRTIQIGGAAAAGRETFSV